MLDQFNMFIVYVFTARAREEWKDNGDETHREFCTSWSGSDESVYVMIVVRTENFNNELSAFLKFRR